jgi:hypothetical protein
MKRVLNLLISWCFLARGEQGRLDHTEEFDMNNLDKLWDYIKEKVPPGGIPGHDDRQYRDLQQYYERKVTALDNTDHPEEDKRRAVDLVNDPLAVCGLTREGRELCQPGKSKELAVAANLLAMSIIKNYDRPKLQRFKQKLDRYPTIPPETLKIMLTKGDLVASERFPISLELKNFGSVTFQEWGQKEFIAVAENAYDRAVNLLREMDQWSASSTGIPKQFKQTFRTYFGDPDAKVDAVKLGFAPGAPVRMVMFHRSLSTSTFSQTRWAWVRAVLNCVLRGLQTNMVRLYFGGRALTGVLEAYTRLPDNTRHPGRINVHVGFDFFAERGERALKGEKSSRAGVLIHEFTHVLAGTVDAELAYSAGQCKALAEKESALTNAQSYAFFVEDALG